MWPQDSAVLCQSLGFSLFCGYSVLLAVFCLPKTGVIKCYEEFTVDYNQQIYSDTGEKCHWHSQNDIPGSVRKNCVKNTGFPWIKPFQDVKNDIIQDARYMTSSRSHSNVEKVTEMMIKIL